MHAHVGEREAKLEWQTQHESLGRPVGVRERPRHRFLSELAVVCIHISAAAVLFFACDRVVVVAIDRGDLLLLDQRAHLVGMRAVADQIAAAVDALDAELIDPGKPRLQGEEIGVDVGDDGYSFHGPEPYPLTNLVSIDIRI